MPVELCTAEEKRLVETTVPSQRKVYQEYNTIAKHLRRQRSMRLDTRAPQAFQRIIGKGVRAPLSWSVIQTIVGLIVKGPPFFTRTPLNSAKKDEAAKLAATCWPLIQTYSRMAHQDLYYLFCDQLVGDGKAFAKLVRRPVKDYPQQKDYKDERAYNAAVQIWLSHDTNNPLRLHRIDPVTCWPDKGYEPSYVVESGQRALAPTLKALGMKLGVNNALVEASPQGETFSDEMMPSGLSPSVQVDEIWTEDYAYFQIGTEHIVKVKNELGFIPYSWRSGMTTSINDPAMESVSAIFPFYGLEPHLNTLLTSVISWAILGGMPTAIVETAAQTAGQLGQEVPPTDIPLGKMVSLKPGQKFYYAAPPAIGDSVVQAINLVLSFYERAGVTQAARGVIGSRTPGLTFSSALEAAGDMLLPIKTNLEGLMEDIVKMTWKAVVQLDTPLLVTGEHLLEGNGRKELTQHKITPRMIGKYYDIHCEVRPTSSQDTQAKGMHAALMKQHGLWSEERAMNYAGVENPVEERIEILKDTIRRTPVYMRAAMEAALSEDPEGQALAQDMINNGEDPFGLMEAEGGGEQPAEGGQVKGGLPARVGGGRGAGETRRPTGPGHGGAAAFQK